MTLTPPPNIARRIHTKVPVTVHEYGCVDGVYGVGREMSAKFTLEGESLLPELTMCDVCSEKLSRFGGRKVREP